MSITGCVTLLTRQVSYAEIIRCYDDVNICLWTDGSSMTQSEAERVCLQRSNSFLPRVTDRRIQENLATFRSTAYNLLGGSGFWIDVKSVGISSRFYWIDGSSMTGLFSSTQVYDVTHHLVKEINPHFRHRCKIGSDYDFLAQKVGQEPTFWETNECHLGTFGQSQLFKMASKMAAKYNFCQISASNYPEDVIFGSKCKFSG